MRSRDDRSSNRRWSIANQRPRRSRTSSPIEWRVRAPSYSWNLACRVAARPERGVPSPTQTPLCRPSPPSGKAPDAIGLRPHRRFHPRCRSPRTGSSKKSTPPHEIWPASPADSMPIRNRTYIGAGRRLGKFFRGGASSGSQHDSILESWPWFAVAGDRRRAAPTVARINPPSPPLAAPARRRRPGRARRPP